MLFRSPQWSRSLRLHSPGYRHAPRTRPGSWRESGRHIRRRAASCQCPQSTNRLWLCQGHCYICFQRGGDLCEQVFPAGEERIARVGDIPEGRQCPSRSRRVLVRRVRGGYKFAFTRRESFQRAQFPFRCAWLPCQTAIQFFIACLSRGLVILHALPGDRDSRGIRPFQ